MLDYMIYIWICFFVLTVIIELSTMNLIAIWFMPGVLTAMVLAHFSVDVWIQVLAFVVITLLLFITMARWIRRIFRIQTACCSLRGLFCLPNGIYEPNSGL